MTGQGQKMLGWLILLACIIAIPVGLMGKSSANKTETKQESSDKKWSSFLPKQDRLVVLRLSGAIYEDEDDSSIFPEVDTATYVKKKLLKIAEDDKVKGVLLRVNSPGGTVGMSQEIYDAVKAVRKEGKPVVVSMGDICASGGYYISAASDYIFANPGTLTGSIGVIMHLMNWQETEKKIGLAPYVIKSGEFKDIGSADRPMTPKERELLQAIIMDSYDQFVTAVSEGRKLDKEEVKKLADGRIYTGRQAEKIKLVDKLGGYDAALAYLQKSARKAYKLNKDLPVDEGSSSMDILSSFFASAQSKTNVKVDLLGGVLPRHFSAAYNKQPLWLME